MYIYIFDMFINIYMHIGEISQFEVENYMYVYNICIQYIYMIYLYVYICL
jgi:hypothetical protein